MFYKSLTLDHYDPALAHAIAAEERRQEDHIELIASENYTSPAVMQAQGTGLTNKYAEGYPGKRYYGGCEYVDVVEQLAIDRAKQLFGADYANVQPHSGSQANAAVYMALLNAGDTVLGMSLAHGGHLTHGASVSFSGKIYNAVQYGINDQGLIDYDEVERLAVERHLDDAGAARIGDGHVEARFIPFEAGVGGRGVCDAGGLEGRGVGRLGGIDRHVVQAARQGFG